MAIPLPIADHFVEWVIKEMEIMLKLETLSRVGDASLLPTSKARTRKRSPKLRFIYIWVLSLHISWRETDGRPHYGQNWSDEVQTVNSVLENSRLPHTLHSSKSSRPPEQGF